MPHTSGRLPERLTPTAKRFPAEQQDLSNSENAAVPQAPATALRPIDQIIVGERFRHEFGDIAGLARSVAEIGLLHPVVITPEDCLIAGQRRLHAAKLLGWTEIAVTMVNLHGIVRGEYAENSIRKDFTLSEAVAIKRALEPLERAAARQRACAGKPMENFSRGRALDKIAKVTGVHRTTLAKADVVDAVAKDQEKFGKLREDMDRTGRVNGPYRGLKNIKQAEAIKAAPPSLPGNGPYRAGITDIAWAYEPDDESAPERGVLPYAMMSIEQACALPVASILHDDCVVGMWVTNYVLVRWLHLPVLEAWGGLEPKTVITWAKVRGGKGHWAKGQTEYLVIATRGKPIVTLTN